MVPLFVSLFQELIIDLQKTKGCGSTDKCSRGFSGTIECSCGTDDDSTATDEGSSDLD